MSLNKSVPNRNSTSLQNASPKYDALLRFLVEPFLESPNSLSLDCEYSSGKERVWIRLAFEGTDKGRVFGRGGRNIQAIRTVLQAVAKAAGQSAYLDIYDDSPPVSPRENTPPSQVDSKRGLAVPPPIPKSTPKPHRN